MSDLQLTNLTMIALFLLVLFRLNRVENQVDKLETKLWQKGIIERK